MKFINVDISTLEGLKKAESLQSKGYSFTLIGMNTLQFSVNTPKPKVF